MRSEFITDVEQQYEVYCKIAEEYGFIDLNAKKSGFRCTTKSNEFNAGWIAFTGAIAAMREDQQSKVDELQVKLNGAEERALTCIKYKDKYLAERDWLQKENAALVHVIKSRDIQLENEKHEYDELMNKLVDSGMKNAELQKRVDALIQKYKDEDRELKLIDEWEKSQIYGLVASELEQAIKGGFDE